MSGQYFISYIVINCSRENNFHKVTLQMHLNLIFSSFLTLKGMILLSFFYPSLKKKKEKKKHLLLVHFGCFKQTFYLKLKKKSFLGEG